MKEYFHGKRKDAYDESLIEEREIDREGEKEATLFMQEGTEIRDESW